jgi:DNA-binding beta-propeller fold protein YncE
VNCVYIVDRNGKIIDSWTQWDNMFSGGRGPHKVFMNPYDPERHVWIVDDMLQQVFEFTNDGKKIVLTLGERLVPGEDDKHFGRPTDMAFLADGAFFVADGYANSRVVKFDRNGKYLMAWGKRGTGPGEFNTPHGLAIDSNRRVFVADRANSRIQIFDENGKYLDQIPNIRSAWHLYISPDQYLWVVADETNKLVKYDLNGKFLYSWGTYGQRRGYMWGVHQFSVDSEGNLYVADDMNGRAQKFMPKQAADPRQLVRGMR